MWQMPQVLRFPLQSRLLRSQTVVEGVSGEQMSSVLTRSYCSGSCARRLSSADATGPGPHCSMDHRGSVARAVCNEGGVKGPPLHGVTGIAKRGGNPKTCSHTEGSKFLPVSASPLVAFPLT